MWSPVRSRLATAGFEAVAPDLLGHGSSPTAPPETTLADLADAVAGQFDQPVHLVGFSLGALIAQHLAIHRPELVSTLTSVSSVCQRTPEERAAVLARLRGAKDDFAGSVRASLTRWYAGTEVPAELVDETQTTLLANDQQSYLSCYRVFATADAELGPRLRSITAPSLAVTGSDDPGSTPQMSQRLADAIPGSRLELFPDTKHMLPVQRPTEFAELFTAFAQEHS